MASSPMDIDKENSQKCYFGKITAKHPMNVPCSGDLLDFKNCSIPIQRIILNRCCFFDLVTGELDEKICENCLSCYGENFLSKKLNFGKNFVCLHPDHPKNKARKCPSDTTNYMRSISLEKSQELYNVHNQWLPFDSKVCKSCYSNLVLKKLKKKEIPASASALSDNDEAMFSANEEAMFSANEGYSSQEDDRVEVYTDRLRSSKASQQPTPPIETTDLPSYSEAMSRPDVTAMQTALTQKRSGKLRQKPRIDYNEGDEEFGSSKDDATDPNFINHPEDDLEEDLEDDPSPRMASMVLDKQTNKTTKVLDLPSNTKKIKALNDLMEACGLERISRFTFKQDWVSSGPNATPTRTRREVLDTLENGILSVLGAISNKESQHPKIFQSYLDSGRFFKRYNGIIQDKYMADIIRYHNSLTRYKDQVRAISGLVNIYTCDHLLSFNKQGNSDISDDNETNDEDDCQHGNLKIIGDFVSWSPRLTRTRFRAARRLFIKFDYPFAEEKQEKIKNWKWSKLHVDLMFDFFVNSGYYQNVAYGSFDDKKSELKMPAVIRYVFTEILTTFITILAK